MTYVADVITAVARQTYVWCMAIVRQKYSSHGHCTLRVATRLQTKLYVTLTTGTSNVRLSYVTLLIISMRFLTLRSATGATTGKTLIHDHQTRTLTYSIKFLTASMLLVWQCLSILWYYMIHKCYYRLWWV